MDCFATHINVPRGLATRYSVSLISRIFPFGKQLNKKLVVLFDVLRQRLVKLPKKENFMLDKVINNQATCAKLKKMLEEKGYTPVEIKEMLHLESVQSVYKWYATARGKGTSMPSVDNMMRLAYLLKVPLEDIYVTYEVLF